MATFGYAVAINIQLIVWVTTITLDVVMTGAIGALSGKPMIANTNIYVATASLFVETWFTALGHTVICIWMQFITR